MPHRNAACSRARRRRVSSGDAGRRETLARERSARSSGRLLTVIDHGRAFEGRPLWAEIDLVALEHNLQQIRSRLSPTTRVCAVVKANAYGHGAVPVSLALEAAGVGDFGVATVDEGVQLRAAGLRGRVLLIGALPPREARRALENDLMVTIDSPESALAVSQVASARGVRALTHLKIDTGMHRFGVNPAEAVALARFAMDLPGVQLEGVSSHFASADEADKSFVHRQMEIFDAIARQLPEVPLRHIGNSACVIDTPEYAHTMVRIGVALYGLFPSGQVRHDLDLRPVLSLRAQLTRCRSVAAGETVSYGRTWQAPQDGVIGLVPLGYADGYRRGLSNRAHMLIDGIRVPVAGRVTMDQTILDLSAIGPREAGTTVTVYGRDGEAEVTVDEIAALESTINYEITCAISSRVPRLAVRGERLERVHTLVGDYAPEPQRSPR